MADMTVLPTWAVWVVSLGSPLGAVAGVVVSNWVARRIAGETETRSKREETMRTLRWAAELATSDDEAKAALGVAQLQALAGSAMNDEQQQAFVDAALAQLVSEPQAAIEQAEAAGEETEVLLGGAHLSGRVSVTASGVVGPGEAVQSSTDEPTEARRGEEDGDSDQRPTGGGKGVG